MERSRSLVPVRAWRVLKQYGWRPFLRQTVKYLTRGTTRMWIEEPSAGATVREPFLLAGWAIDTAARTGTGVDVVQAWARSVSGSEGDPIFLGQAIYGVERPDVGGQFGSQFTNSGYNLTITGLNPGPYEIVVEAQSAVTERCSDRWSTTVTIGGEKGVERIKTDDAHLCTGEQMIPDFEPQDWNRRIHHARYFYALGFVGPTSTVLDAGCGAGYGIQLVALKTSGKCLGLDYRKDIVDYAQTRYPATNLTYQVARLDEKVDLGKFDVCLSFDVLEHIGEESLDTYLANLSNALRTGASPLLVSTPQSQKKENRECSNEFHVREYTLDEFYDTLSDYFIVDTMLFGIGMTAVCYKK